MTMLPKARIWIGALACAALVALCGAGVRRDFATIRAMREYRAEHPRCEVCNWPRVHVHHVAPVESFPELAACPTNFVSLCEIHHWWAGHCGNSGKRYNANMRATVAALRAAYEATAQPTEYKQQGRKGQP